MMDSDTSEIRNKEVPEDLGDPVAEAGGFGRIWYRPLDGGTSRTERRAVQLVRTVRHILPMCLMLFGDYLAIIGSGEASVMLLHVIAPGLFPLQLYSVLFVDSA